MTVNAPITTSPFRYADGKTPEGYVCVCGAHGVRLYREYQTFLDYQTLRCRACAIKKRRTLTEDEEEIDRQINSAEHSIGWLVAAVPTEDGQSYWGFTSVPSRGIKWWNELPKS